MLIDKIIEGEGTLEYQKKLGYFRNGKFYEYLCSEGVPTIGYGHAIKKGEGFPDGITDAQAMDILRKDLARAVSDARALHVDPKEEVNDILAQMVFQLGRSRASKFVRFFEAIKAGDYSKAADELINSKWYNQTPNRVNKYVSILRWL